MEEKKQRVFIHEIGHFISHEMNKRYYLNFLGTESIKIYTCPNYPGEYCGETIPNKPENYDGTVTKVTLVRLPNFLISLIYGCIIQSIYQNENLRVCVKTNGKRDFDEWINNLHSWNISFVNREIIKILETYLNLCVEKNLFEKIFKLKYCDYILYDYGNAYEIDIEKLNVVLEDFYTEHYLYYNQLVTDHKKIIEENKKNNC